MKKTTLNSVVIPFVGTLNDDDVASPVFYLDGHGVTRERLVETPAIQLRKERMRHYLRGLGARFVNGEPLYLYAIFVTRDERSIDATNVLDLIQNAGNRIIWSDDSQFVEVFSRRMVVPYLKLECEFTVVWIGEVPNPSRHKTSFGTSRLQKIAEDYRTNYDVEKCLAATFSESEAIDFRVGGFWSDDRFLDIPVLKPAYIRWHMKTQGDCRAENGPGSTKWA